MAKYTVANVNSDSGENFDCGKIVLVILAIIVIMFLMKALSNWSCGGATNSYGANTNNGYNDYQTQGNAPQRRMNGQRQVV